MDIPFLPPLEWISKPVAVLLIGGFTLVQMAILTVTAYLAISWPLRRRERSRWIIDLLDSGLKRGWSIQRCLADPISSGDRVFGYRYRLFAAELAAGATLSDSLKVCPSLVHPRIAALLSLGERTNTLQSMLQVCRHSLHDASARFHASRHHLMSFSIIMIPLGIGIIFFHRLTVLPRYREIFVELSRETFVSISRPTSPPMILSAVEWLMLLLTFGLVMSLVAGPWILRIFRRIHPRLLDGLIWQLPWCRNRLLRDTTQSMAILLDAGLPEGTAVRLAGQHQANLRLRRETDLSSGRLEKGEALPQAIESWDPRGELKWRLLNSQNAPGASLSETLRGWWQVLDTRAVQQEQIAAQLFSCAVILLNGWIVSQIALTIFHPLVHLIHAMTLW